MRYLTSSLLILAYASAQAATTVTEDFSSGSGDFTTLQNTSIVTPNNGNLEFTSTNGQGSVSPWTLPEILEII